jgi:hypothetical protein
MRGNGRGPFAAASATLHCDLEKSELGQITIQEWGSLQRIELSSKRLVGIIKRCISEIVAGQQLVVAQAGAVSGTINRSRLSRGT